MYGSAGIFVWCNQYGDRQRTRNLYVTNILGSRFVFVFVNLPVLNLVFDEGGALECVAWCSWDFMIQEHYFGNKATMSTHLDWYNSLTAPAISTHHQLLLRRYAWSVVFSAPWHSWTQLWSTVNVHRTKGEIRNLHPPGPKRKIQYWNSGSTSNSVFIICDIVAWECFHDISFLGVETVLAMTWRTTCRVPETWWSHKTYANSPASSTRRRTSPPPPILYLPWRRAWAATPPASLRSEIAQLAPCKCPHLPSSHPQPISSNRSVAIRLQQSTTPNQSVSTTATLSNHVRTKKSLKIPWITLIELYNIHLSVDAQSCTSPLHTRKVASFPIHPNCAFMWISQAQGLWEEIGVSLPNAFVLRKGFSDWQAMTNILRVLPTQ